MNTEDDTRGGLELAPQPPSLDTQNQSSFVAPSAIDSLQISEQVLQELAVFDPELPNIALDEAELATLNALIERYDRVIHDLDLLNDQIENLLSEESIKGCGS